MSTHNHKTNLLKLIEVDDFYEFDQWFEKYADSYILELQRNSEGDFEALDKHMLRSMLEHAWHAGIHHGASNPYC